MLPNSQACRSLEGFSSVAPFKQIIHSVSAIPTTSTSMIANRIQDRAGEIFANRRVVIQSFKKICVELVSKQYGITPNLNGLL